MQKVIIMVGIPGAGKSTLAKTNFASYTYVNQDTLGSRGATLKAFNEALSRGEDVVLDRCNSTYAQRSEWIKIAAMFRAEINAVYLEVPLTTAIKRVTLRQDHQTLGGDIPNGKKSKIVKSFYNELQPPVLTEGFNVVLHIRN